MATVAVAFGRSAARTSVLLARRQLHLPHDHVGTWIRFDEGGASRVYRETVNLAPRSGGPSLLVVAFELRGVGHSRLLHALFRGESMLNTPLFAGFPGFRSKLWLEDARSGVYHGIYEWDGAGEAESYATTLASLLRLVSLPGTVRFHVEPGLTPASALADPSLLDRVPGDAAGRWWRFRTYVPGE